MKISILCPSHRSSYDAIGKIFSLASLSNNVFEVIVRDNSLCPIKRSLLGAIDCSNFFYVPIAHNLGPEENFSKSLELATGDYIIFCADDDYIFVNGIFSAYDFICKTENNNYAGISFGCLITSSGADQVIRYGDLFDVDSACLRLINYTSAMLRFPNTLFYSLFDSDVLRKAFKFSSELPFRFSYADQLICIFILLSGKIHSIDDVAYGYDLGEWNSREKSHLKDRSYYKRHGIDPEVNLIHQLLQAVEGYFLINSNLARELTGEDLTRASESWFLSKLKQLPDCSKYLHSENTTLRQSAMLVKKIMSSTTIVLSELLDDLSMIIAISSREKAGTFNRYWRSL